MSFSRTWNPRYDVHYRNVYQHKSKTDTSVGGAYHPQSEVPLPSNTAYRIKVTPKARPKIQPPPDRGATNLNMWERRALFTFFAAVLLFFLCTLGWLVLQIALDITNKL